MLDVLDKELVRRGHNLSEANAARRRRRRFVRYADDCNVYVRSRRAGERVPRQPAGCRPFGTWIVRLLADDGQRLPVRGQPAQASGERS